ncbi:hypothetical protein [Virgibacillus siamensis]|uniref:hypothetical protein n=1 Tax=Virgibacillus siamensis TaxID=480071 RepID=UPI000986AECD|nr:hypothetical protein [Virgibacillus siamensis]
MKHLVLLYLASILAGYALTLVPTSAVVTPAIADVLALIGGLAMVVFAIALLVLGTKALLNKN